MAGWIDICKSEPELGVPVLCYTNTLKCEVLSRRQPMVGEESYNDYPYVWDRDEFFHGAHPEYVTHWQPLPEPPKLGGIS